jgi:hypothetical protein
MALLKNLPYLFILILIGYIIFLRECTPARIVNHYTTDTIVYNDTAYVPKLDTTYLTKVDTVYLDSIILKTIETERIDTVYLLREHFTKNFYTDTILNDSKGLIVVNDTLYRNRIKSRLNQIKIFSHKPKVSNHYYIGMGVIGSSDRMGLMAQGGLLTKKRNLYTIGYDVINKDISLSFYIKLF